jgi:hypothetical protein
MYRHEFASHMIYLQSPVEELLASFMQMYTTFTHTCISPKYGHIQTYFGHIQRPARHDLFYYTSTKCAIPDDMAGQQRF